MKKILYIGNALKGKNINPSYMLQLGSLLEREGYDVKYASSFSNKVFRLCHMIIALLSSGRRLVLIDTYSTKNFYYAFIISQLCRLLKREYIPILHGGELPSRLDKSSEKSAKIFRNSKRNISPSKYLEEIFKEKGHSNTIHIPNALSIENYDFTERDFSSIKLLWVRSFSNIYNPLMAIEVLKILKDQNYTAELCMVGPDKDGNSNKIREISNALDLEVKLTGKLSKIEWIELSKEYTFFINTANFDNMPVSVIEAMALGIPVVSTNVGGMPYLIDHNENGILVSINDANAMAEAIINLHKDSAKTKRISNNAREKVQDFDWDAIKHKWFSLLNSN